MSGTFTDHQVHQWLAQVAESGWLSLHFDSPGLGAVGLAEISGGGYARQRVPFTMPTGRAIWSLDDARFTGLRSNILTHFGVWDAQHNGNLMAYGELPERVTIANGWGYVLHGGDLAISFG